jgi:hypothetical protein
VQNDILGCDADRQCTIDLNQHVFGLGLGQSLENARKIMEHTVSQRAT